MASALNSRAEIFVTGDAEILDLADKPIPIVNPRELWTLLSSPKKKN